MCQPIHQFSFELSVFHQLLTHISESEPRHQQEESPEPDLDLVENMYRHILFRSCTTYAGTGRQVMNTR
ncbi:hypothetical protein MtrunA17_Chr4g0060571 [Medicago truncatula]|uniref:Uncharacterized protein n=1 Tax=Medicago truncatula TaxID=3880 RepID=A0A396IDJ6_MEDTR|nr:hypothetical protein MtrunA17_Chr4g0060571 [Medicago truncatula]